MTQLSVKDLYTKDLEDNTTVSLEGSIKTIRGSKNISFIELNDGSCFKSAQIIVKKSNENFEQISKLPIASTITVEGAFVKTPDAPQPFEVHGEKVELVGRSDSDYPLQKKKTSYEFLRTIAHLRPRTNTFYSVFRIRSLAAFAVHEYLQHNDFVYVNTPIITSSDTEGAGEMFRVTTMDMDNLPKDDQGHVDNSKDFFKTETNLTVSGQLPEEAFTMAFKNVYTFGPTFRAENSHTPRHASEFWMIEPDMAYTRLPGMMDVAEGLLKYVINYVLDHAKDELEFLDENVKPGLIEKLQKTASEDFARVTYTDAVKLLQDADVEFKVPVEWGIDLQSEHERYLCEDVYKRPTFLTDYPRDIKAFYMRDNDDGKTVAAADCLVPGIGEIVGGSEREERYDVLNDKIKEFDLNPEEYDWYEDLRKYGEIKHSGFGIGFERLVMYVTGMENIRDVIPFPREPGSAKF
ncbi:Asparagine--tRNA ligase [Apilactobacillus kunkeei]|uniref:Asparagine--tRNA ligase n=2 Tax=Apilactobacillus kunkeei TaxID=148814 RepID=A0A0M9DDM3_9LACO|nr:MULTISPECIES: asparagine--tRNA ligase [Lactobacillaceae]KOY73568.1 Asparagine--tRNA ligase [Apilactobacillus kunkeei DSM 12361 = ATCC 700308]KOY76800.1 Asparagine--tRNA ligase [Apilactobacillus kunkeei]KPN82415.1 Asparagine--tRNA ligase [Apilactobacillus kunkeei]KPN83583.1 Asparagine--tRNA ligase [Apilactobacillus kunkeei]KRK25158.1 asparaginyl-tRNA synthetase [Apilactobacillus kunkeei DSM 12361 = ATCC 700308]